jgi:outer membrane immunogenic protein
MPVKAAPAPVAPAFTWTGWYVGLNGGGLWGETKGNFAPPVNPIFPWQADISQGIAGVTSGSNWQFGQFVIGTESNYDVGIGNPGSTAGNGLAGPCGFPVGTSCQSRINDLFTFGGRLGWAGSGVVGNGNWLLFAQGGYARANISTNGVVNGTNVPFSQSQNWHNGWFAGVGFDYALSSVVSVGVDYKHYEFDSENHLDLFGPANNTVMSANADAVFARINFKIWGPGSTIPHF